MSQQSVNQLCEQHDLHDNMIHIHHSHGDSHGSLLKTSIFVWSP